MLKMINYYHILVVITITALFLAACTAETSEEESSQQQEDTNNGEVHEDRGGNGTEEENDSGEGIEDPISISIAFPWGEENFWESFGKVDDNLEHINLEYIDVQGLSEPIQELFTAGIVPDIIFANFRLAELKDLDVILYLDDLVEEHNYDLSNLNPGVIADVRAQDPEGQGRLGGMPNATGMHGLYYNKEVFDLFGVSYPDEDMTWEETLALARQMTGERDGEQYVGLEFGAGSLHGGSLKVPLRQFAVTATDPETGEVLVNEKEEFRRYFELMESFYSIPDIIGEHTEDRHMFAEKYAAMNVHWHDALQYGWGDPEYQENMDIVPLPVWEDMPNVGTNLATTEMVINRHGEHIDEAFEVLVEYLGHENQTHLMRNAIIVTPLDDSDLFGQYGAETEHYQNKNVEALFAREPAIFDDAVSEWEQYVEIADYGYYGMVPRFAESEMDVGEALRLLQEESEIKIEEARQNQ